MKRDKKESPTVSDLVLEERAKELIENPIMPSTQTESLATVGDARVERVRKSNGQGDRLAVRAATGRFTKMTTAIAHADAKAAQNFLAEKVKDDLGKEASRKHHLRVALFDGAIKAAKEPRALGNATKAFEALNTDAALTQAKEALLQDQSHIQDPVRVVVVAPINLMHPEVIEFDKRKEEKRQPSFVEAEVVSTNPPQGQ